MPYESDRQRAWMHIHEPEIAERWDREMKDDYYHNSRNFESDTFDRLDQESAMPFVTPDAVDADGNAMITMADDDAEYMATSMDCRVDADGSVTTRAKAGPSNQGGEVQPSPGM